MTMTFQSSESRWISHEESFHISYSCTGALSCITNGHKAFSIISLLSISLVKCVKTAQTAPRYHLEFIVCKRKSTQKVLKRSISQMCCKQMRKWKKFSIWCFLHPQMAAWHMINDCSPQQFHISPFHGWFGGQKKLRPSVCGAWGVRTGICDP